MSPDNPSEAEPRLTRGTGIRLGGPTQEVVVALGPLQDLIGTWEDEGFNAI